MPVQVQSYSTMIFYTNAIVINCDDNNKITSYFQATQTRISHLRIINLFLR